MAPVFDGGADGQGLLHLAEIEKVLEAAGVVEVALEHAGDAPVAAGLLLVEGHDGGFDVVLLPLSVAPHGAEGGEGLEAEFAAEAGADVEVGFKGFAAVPDGPVVHVSGGVVVPGADKASLAVAGGAGPEEAGGVGAAHGLGDAGVEAQVVGGLGFFGRGVAAGAGAGALVVAAPEGDAGVVAQAQHLRADLGADVLEEAGGGGVVHAGEHAVLPDEQAELVAEFVEAVALPLPAAPDAQHVHVGGDGVAQQALVDFGLLPRWQGVAGDPVGALAEELAPVDGDGEALADVVGTADDFQLAQADGARDFVVARDAAAARLALGQAGGGVGVEADAEFVERLLALPGGVPEAGLGHAQAQAGFAAARLDVDGAAFGSGHVGADAERQGGFADALDGDVQIDEPGPAECSGGLGAALGAGGADAGGADAEQVDAPAGAADHQAGAPVPAGVALHLAQHVHVGQAVVVRDGGGEVDAELASGGFGAGGSLAMRGAEADVDSVEAGVQQVPHGQVQRAKHVAALPRLFAVDLDAGDGVEVVEAQKDLGAGEQVARQFKLAAENPVALAPGLDALLVEPDVGVGDASGGQQGAVLITRHLGCDADAAARHLPGSRQIHCLHHANSITIERFAVNLTFGLPLPPPACYSDSLICSRKNLPCVCGAASCLSSACTVIDSARRYRWRWSAPASAPEI